MKFRTPHDFHSLQAPICTSRIGCSETSKGTMRRFCRGILPLQAEIQRIPLQSSRPGCSRHYAHSGERRGSGGKRFVASPRRLCARGSMTLRRAKVALKLRCSIASEDKQSRDCVQRMPSHPLTRELSRRESLWHCQLGYGGGKCVFFIAGVYSSPHELPQSSLTDVPSAHESSSLGEGAFWLPFLLQ